MSTEKYGHKYLLFFFFLFLTVQYCHTICDFLALLLGASVHLPPSLHTLHSTEPQKNKRVSHLGFGEQMFLADFLYKNHKSCMAGLYLTFFLWSAVLEATESHIYTTNESHE